VTDLLLVDFHETMPVFREIVEQMHECESDEDEVMEMLITYLDSLELVDQGLDAYAERIWEDHMIAGCPQDGARLIEGAMMLGNHLFDVLKRADVYDAEGWLGGLHFEGWRGRNKTVAVFKRDPEEERCC
jgi:hypothetical protein